MKKLIAAFKYADVQTAVIIWRWLKTNDKTMEDLEEYIKSGKHNPSLPTPKRKKCPKCGKGLYVFPVNTKSCNQVGGGYKLHHICRHCEYEKFE